MRQGLRDPLLPDPGTPFGERVHRRLREEPVIWLSTVARDGTPEPNPVWFLWDGDTILVYNVAGAHRLRHVRSRPQVALHLDRTATEVGAIVVTGLAEVVEDHPPADQVPAWVAKYGDLMSSSPRAWATRFPVALRVRPTKVRGH